MKPRDLGPELKREEAQRAQRGMPPGARAAVQLRLRGTLGQGQPRASRWRFALAGVALAGLVAAAVWSQWPSRRVGGLERIASSDDVQLREPAPGTVEISAGTVTLRDAATGTSIQNAGPLTLRRDPEGLRVVRGTARVSVTPRPKTGPPVVVLTSGGAIEVTGTRFTVEQREQAGSVALEEGSIRFRAPDGRTVALAPGQTLGWPLEAPAPAAAPVVEREPEPVAPRTPVARRPALDEVLREVEVLRSRKQFEAAVLLLGDAMKTQPAAAQERLSFELGSLLTHQLHDAGRACAHWSAHRRRFPSGRYGAELQQAMTSLSCGTSR